MNKPNITLADLKQFANNTDNIIFSACALLSEILSWDIPQTGDSGTFDADTVVGTLAEHLYAGGYISEVDKDEILTCGY